MDELAAGFAGESSYARKAAMYEMLARECTMHLSGIFYVCDG